MPAADLLSLLTSGLAAGPAAKGVAGGVGKGVGKGLGAAIAIDKPGQTQPGKAGKAGEAASDGKVADAGNPFGQALAALIAAQGQTQPAQVPATPAAGEDAATPETTPTAASKGLQTALAATALAATAQAGAQGKGLAKALANQTAQTPAADGAASPAAAAVAAPVTAQAKTSNDAVGPTVTPAIVTAGAQSAAAGPTPAASVVADQTKAAQDLAARLATPSPRADRANDLAKGPALPAWGKAATPPPTAAPSAAAPAGQPAAPEPAVTPLAQDASTSPTTAATAPAADPATLSLAGAQVAAKPTLDTNPVSPAAGKAVGKDKDGKDLDQTTEAHAPRTLGKGLETAAGQARKAAGEDSQADAPPTGASVKQDAGADKPQADVTALAAADQTRAQAAVAAHTDKTIAASHTVAHLAEQIVSKVDGKSTRFDVTLDPAGLGKVDVKIEIGRSGEINAALSFDNPQAAAELRSRVGELRTALEQAGFDLSKGGLSFDFSGQNQGRNLWDQQAGAAQPAWARASFTDLATAADPPALAHHRTIDASGVDVTV